MKLRTGLLASLVAGISVIGATAHADLGTDVQKPFRGYIGGIWPSSTTLSHSTSTSGLFGGISYDFMGPKGMSQSPTYEGLYVDSYYSSGNGLHLTTIGVGADARMYMSGTTNVSSGARTYLLGGLGVYFANSNFTISTSNTRFGAKVGLGYEMQSGVFLEAGYTYIAPVGNLQISGFTAVIGYRF
jgi:hypothetical protein